MGGELEGQHGKDRHILNNFYLLKMFPRVTLAVQDLMPRDLQLSRLIDSVKGQVDGAKAQPR